MEVSSENDRFSSNELVISVEVDKHQKYNEEPSFFFLHSKTDTAQGNLIADKSKMPTGGNGFIVSGVVLSVAIAVVAAGFMVHKVSRFVFDGPFV